MKGARRQRMFVQLFVKQFQPLKTCSASTALSVFFILAHPPLSTPQQISKDIIKILFPRLLRPLLMTALLISMCALKQLIPTPNTSTITPLHPAAQNHLF